MCSKAIVGLLSVCTLVWAGLPATGGQSQGGSDLADNVGSGADAFLHAADASNLKARNPNPPNGACGVDMLILTWTPGDTAALHKLYLGRNAVLGPADLWGSTPYPAIYLAAAEPGATYYWRVDEIEADMTTVHEGDVWCFTMSPATPCPPVAPWGVVSLCCDIVLNWPGDPLAVKYEVYLDTDLTAVAQLSPAALKGSTTQTTFHVDGLVAGVTYFWRANVVGADNTVFPGQLWSFTTAPCEGQGVLWEWWGSVTGTDVTDFWDKYYNVPPSGQDCLACFEGPTDWADNYGSRLSALLVPPKTGEYTFWIASDDQSVLWLSPDTNPANSIRIAGVADWTDSRQWDKEPGQKSAPISLEAGKRYHIEAIHKEGTGGDNLAVAWAGPGIPDRTVICIPYVESPGCGRLTAHSPNPADGAQLSSSPVLTWQPGREALQHDVYFSDDYLAVLKACRCACSVYRGRYDQATYDPGPLAPGTYYWRVDEVDPDNPASVWTGCVWSFTIETGISDCLYVIDDFESYAGSAALRMVWTGSPQPVVLEQSIAHTGNQSMRMDYDNQHSPYHSEAQPQIAVPANWLPSGVTSLSLWFRGRLGNEASSLYLRVGDATGRSFVVSYPDPGAILQDKWTNWQIPLQSLTGVSLTHVNEVAIGVGGPVPDGIGTIYIDDICLR